MPMNNRLLRPTTGLDPDAAKYLQAVEAADGEPLEPAVRTAINAFFRDTKTAGVFSSLKACCILAGARTLAGALVPVVGDAPTAYGFVEGDFDRLGLTGDGTSYLDSNRANDADPQDDKHIAVYKTAYPTRNGGLVGTYSTQAGASWLFCGASGASGSVRINGAFSAGSLTFGVNTLIGGSRASPSSLTYRVDGTSVSTAIPSSAPASDTLEVFRAVLNQVSDAKLAFYSLGTSLDLAKLDSHVTAYVTAIGAAL